VVSCAAAAPATSISAAPIAAVRIRIILSFLQLLGLDRRPVRRAHRAERPASARSTRAATLR
jgi:hypothetical protein